MSEAGGALLSTREVAELFGCTVDWLYRNRARLEATRGFPKPLFTGRYDPLALLAWRLSQLPPALRAELAAAGAGAERRGWEEELDRRAAALGAFSLSS